ncbi:MAG TPA: hypothetical protein VD931_18595 [Baekduia sp.]|nr:hypothetical protein [Baekduia sp.]
MHHDDLHRHLLASRDPARLSELLGGCWPGGGHDRLEPAALPWLRAWRPARAAAALPACSCGPGPCGVCN